MHRDIGYVWIDLWTPYLDLFLDMVFKQAHENN